MSDPADVVGVLPTTPKVESALALAREHPEELAHLRQVARLAAILFRELEPLHGMGDREHELLCCAALLHDIGISVSYQRHHKHSLRLILERPLVGFGPGTYETSYGVFQSWENLTSHSSFQGDRGDAHSEYFSALAEQGVPGLILVVALFGVALWSGLHGAVETKNGDRRWLILGWTAAVTSLAVGSLFNAYFEVDRIAPLLWLSCAALVIFSATSPGNR